MKHDPISGISFSITCADFQPPLSRKLYRKVQPRIADHRAELRTWCERSLFFNCFFCFVLFLFVFFKQLWTGVIVGSLYVVSIGLVALLESDAVGWK